MVTRRTLHWMHALADRQSETYDLDAAGGYPSRLTFKTQESGSLERQPAGIPFCQHSVL